MTYCALGQSTTKPLSPVAVKALAPAVASFREAVAHPWGRTLTQQEQATLYPLYGWPIPGRSALSKHQGLQVSETDFMLASEDARPTLAANNVKFASCSRLIIQSLPDKELAARAGAATLLFFKEDRMRRLLDTLALPQFGFPDGLAALAYDASLMAPVAANPSFVVAVKRARSEFLNRFPRTRWKRKPEAWRFDCEKDFIMSDAWVDPANAAQTCVGKAVLAAPSVGRYFKYGGDSQLSAVSGPKARRIPVWEAIRRQGNTLVPTPWFEGFLNCLLGQDWRTARALRSFKLPGAARK